MGSASRDKSIAIYELMKEERIYTFERAHEGLNLDKQFEISEWIYCMTITPDNKHIITGAGDRTICMFSIEKREKVHEWKNIQNGKMAKHQIILKD